MARLNTQQESKEGQKRKKKEDGLAAKRAPDAVCDLV
jgi:hypothetical protein